MLAPHTVIEDVFFGLYNWLDNHPTEAVLVSINFEGGTGTPNDAQFQTHLYDVFNGSLAKRYWLQSNGTVCYFHHCFVSQFPQHGFQLGTLGEARGSLTLLQRFDYTLLPPQEDKRIGIHLNNWLDNHWPSFQLSYNPAMNQFASIEVRPFDFILYVKLNVGKCRITMSRALMQARRRILFGSTM